MGFSRASYHSSTAVQSAGYPAVVWRLLAPSKNAQMSYVPDYIMCDTDSYRRVQTNSGDTLSQVICPLSQETRRRDADAFAGMMNYIRSIDEGHYTTIMVQVENEPGFLARIAAIAAC